MPTFETVREMGLALPDTAESTSYGTPALKVHGKLIARLREDCESLALRTDFGEREELLAADPETYYITGHYRDFPWVLVRLSRVRPDALRDLLRRAWRLASEDGKQALRKRKRRS